MEHPSRRALINGAALTVAATAAGALPAIAAAEPAADPVFGAIAERGRLLKLAHEASDRFDTARQGLPVEVLGNPVLTSAISKEIGLPCIYATHERVKGGRYIWRVEQGAIERFNEHTEQWVRNTPEELAKRKAEGAARLAWWRTERRRQTAVKVRAGYYRLEREMEAAWDAFNEADRAVAVVAATGWAGMLAKLRLQQQLSDDGILDTDDLIASAIADADRLLAAGATA